MLSFFCVSVAAAPAAVVIAATAVALARDDEDKDDYPPAAVISTHNEKSPLFVFKAFVLRLMLHYMTAGEKSYKKETLRCAEFLLNCLG